MLEIQLMGDIEKAVLGGVIGTFWENFYTLFQPEKKEIFDKISSYEEHIDSHWR